MIILLKANNYETLIQNLYLTHTFVARLVSCKILDHVPWLSTLITFVWIFDLVNGMI
jgi:hypothetical protein